MCWFSVLALSVGGHHEQFEMRNQNTHLGILTPSKLVVVAKDFPERGSVIDLFFVMCIRSKGFEELILKNVSLIYIRLKSKPKIAVDISKLFHVSEFRTFFLNQCLYCRGSEKV